MAPHHEGTALSNHQRIIDGFRQVSEERAHLLCRRQMVAGSHPRAVVLGDIGAVRDTQQSVVSFVHRGVDKKGLVGGHQRQVVDVGEVDQRSLDAILDRQTMALHLDIEPLRKQQFQLLQHGLGIRLAVFCKLTPDGAAHAATKRN